MKEKKYFLDRFSFPAKAALVCLLLAFVLKGASGLLNRVVLEDRLTLFSFLLFLVSCLLYAVSLLLFGKKWLWITVGPFMLGIMTFVVRLFTFDNLLQVEVSIPRMLISILYYLIITAVYSVTVSGGLRGRWFLILLFLFPLAGHIIFDIIPAFQQKLTLSVSQILAELSVLIVIIGMIFTALSFKHVGQTATEKRKKKAAEVVPPIPGNKLDEKPAVISDPAQPEVAAAEPEKPAAVESPVSEESESSEQLSAVEGASLPEETALADDVPDEVPYEEESYDPFAPSAEPIRLTLDPFPGEDHKNTEEADNSNSGEENG